MADLTYEQAYDGQRVAGIDEVGRGPLAGPVVCAAVVISDPDLPFLQDIRDSKKLTAKKRESLAEQIHRHCDYVIAEIGVDVIDRINILQATFQGMCKAADSINADIFLIDGKIVPPPLQGKAEAIIKGDDKSLSIACASIIAKVYRDRLMVNLAKDFPAYGWERNMGYGTAQHMRELALSGASPHHRRSFAPVARAIESGAQTGT